MKPQQNILHDKTAGWENVRFHDAFVDVVPLFDEYEHFLGDECWCGPETRRHPDELPIVVHNASDGRQ